MPCARGLLAIGLCCAVVTVLPAAEPEPFLEVTGPTAAVAVGDRVTLRVQARGGDEGLFGELEVAAGAGSDWELLDGPRPVAGARPPAWEVVLAPMAVGELEPPLLRVSVRGAEGETFEARPRSAPPIRVVSVLAPDDSKEPAPLLDPIGARGLPWEWVPPVIVLASPLLAAGVLWLRRRRAAGGDHVVALTPVDELRRAVAEIGERIGRQPAEGVCDGLATAVRRYLERRTGEPALEMTSFEIRRLGRDLGWPEDVRRCLQRVLETADSIRFGRRPATDSVLRAAVEAALIGASSLEDHLRPVDGEVRDAARELAS